MAALAAALYPSVLRGTASGEGPCSRRIGSGRGSSTSPTTTSSMRSVTASEPSRPSARFTATAGRCSNWAAGWEAGRRRVSSVSRRPGGFPRSDRTVSPRSHRRSCAVASGGFRAVPRRAALLRAARHEPAVRRGGSRGRCVRARVWRQHPARRPRPRVHSRRGPPRASAGGALVLSECVRPFPGRPVYIEFLFNLLESFRAPRLVEPWRPSGGFLTPEHWTAALGACGFRDVTVYPDIARIREVCPSFVVAAFAAVRA